MAVNNNFNRLENFRNGEVPSTLYTTIQFHAENPSDCVAKIISVMKLVVVYTEETWPSDEYWKQHLPNWLLSTFHVYTAEELAEILRDRSALSEYTWSLGSWLDRMRDRDWEWWSYSTVDNLVTIHVTIDGWPTSTRVLEWLTEAAGGNLVT